MSPELPPEDPFAETMMKAGYERVGSAWVPLPAAGSRKVIRTLGHWVAAALAPGGYLANRLLMPSLEALFRGRERKRLARSHERPFFAGGRDSFTYYERGRTVDVHAEFVGNERRIYHQSAMRWSDGVDLSGEERKRVVSELCTYLTARRTPWHLSP
jgi:hypothetical protein